MLLANFECDVHFFKNKELSKKIGFPLKPDDVKIGFPLKPDDVIVMSSNVHEWKGKPRSIVWCQCLMQQIIRNKVTPNNS